MWPEHSAALPDIPNNATMLPDQTETLANAINQHQLQLRCWMHWHAGTGASHSVNSKTTKILSRLLQPNKQKKQPCEVYLKTYFKIRVQLEITKGMLITEMFEAESPEFKAEVQRISDQQIKDNRKHGKGVEGMARVQPDDNESDINDDVKTNPVILHNNIQQCGPVLQHMIDHFSHKTQWMLTILMGGPNPLDPKGGNVITSLHSGRMKNGHDFSQLYPKFNSEVVDAFGEFLSCACSKFAITIYNLNLTNDLK
ncbi:hypothetical protein L210DRAFT_876828 [Boletus edulis BED1]|uniref:Uncharacterized protein n=1 Tax=Boletus edulis BED1 TaxID=1328754 RepID=A0AAD4BV64_BOLED|nr:hypothetical protein L210DRAFT_876828 [Boletus edulis BED1]